MQEITVGTAKEEDALHQHERSGTSSWSTLLHSPTFNRQCKDEPVLLEAICFVQTPFERSCLALLAVYLLEPLQTRGIMPGLPLLSLIITSRKHWDLALSASFVSPEQGNRQMSFALRQIRPGCLPGRGWRGERRTMSEHTFSTSPH